MHLKLYMRKQELSRERSRVHIDTLRSRLKASGITPGTADRQNWDSKRLRELEAENRSLRKQLTQKDGVIDVLKKSVGILSKP